MSHSFEHEVTAAGAEAYPRVRLAPAALAARLSKLAPLPQPTPEALLERFLIAACAEQAPGALEALEQYCARELSAVLARHAPATGGDDAMQAVRLRLLAAFEGYRGTGSLRGWVRVVATRAIVDGVRASNGALAGDEASSALPAHTDVELELLRGRYRELFQVAFRAAVARLPPRQRTLLRQHYVDDLSIDALGALYGVHRSSAARWVVAARDALREATRQALAEHAQVEAREVDSLVRVLHSDLHASLGAFAAE